MSIFFHCGMPRCAPGIGGTTLIWGHAKKISGALRRSLCPTQLQNRVGAYVHSERKTPRDSFQRKFLLTTSLETANNTFFEWLSLSPPTAC